VPVKIHIIGDWWPSLSGDASDERVISPPVYSTAFLITCAAAVVQPAHDDLVPADHLLAVVVAKLADESGDLPPMVGLVVKQVKQDVHHAKSGAVAGPAK